jgi:hypothetical protein
MLMVAAIALALLSQKPERSLWAFTYGFAEQAAIALILALGLLTYRLACAYRRYLRFRHAILTVIASQVMVGLVLLKLMYVRWHGAWG